MDKRVMTQKEVFEEFADDVCKECPFFTEGRGNYPGAICEGMFCEDAAKIFCENNNIELKD